MPDLFLSVASLQWAPCEKSGRERSWGTTKMTYSNLHRGLFGAVTGRVLVTIASTMLFMCGSAVAESKFEKALVYLERNVADDDIEVRFAVTANEKGLTALRVIAPDGRVVVDFKAPQSNIGIRALDLESPEPVLNDGRLQADFPPGVYRFEGTVVDGETLYAEATLSHALPEAPKITSPEANRVDVPTQGGKVRWEPVKDAVSYVIVVDDENESRALKVTLPASSTSFSIPAGFLISATKYKLAVGAVLKDGNRSFQEFEFRASRK